VDELPADLAVVAAGLVELAAVASANGCSSVAVFRSSRLVLFTGGGIETSAESWYQSCPTANSEFRAGL
jgi:hypothetical protein